MARLMLGSLFALGLAACAAKTAPAPAAATPAAGATPAAAEQTRRPFAPTLDGQRIRRGIAYGPFREGQAPGGPLPTAAQIEEDLRIVADRWPMIRVYASEAPTEQILETIRSHDLPVRVVVGAWIDPDDTEANAREVEALIRLANAYPEVVVGVNVGNETQVSWSAHRSDREMLIEHLRTVRSRVSQPVATSDDYNFWNKPESQAVADEIDFIMLHAYAMWNQQSLDNAIAWTDATYDSIVEAHPEHPVVLAETGWATELNPEGSEHKYIKAPAGEAEQARFYEAFTAWADRENVSYFYFEAFDEPWKGSDDPREVEKHWGLYHVDRTPKAAMVEATGE